MKEVEEGNKKISNILKEILEQNKYEEYTNFNEKTHINNLKYDIESKYKLFLGSSLSETDVKAAIDKAWNSFYGLKKLNMKKSYKKSY